MSLHLMHHIVQGIRQHGPVHSWTMYVYERFNSWICQRVMNRLHPEATVMETYKASKLVVHTIFIQLSSMIQ